MVFFGTSCRSRNLCARFKDRLQWTATRKCSRMLLSPGIETLSSKRVCSFPATREHTWCCSGGGQNPKNSLEIYCWTFKSPLKSRALQRSFRGLSVFFSFFFSSPPRSSGALQSTRGFLFVKPTAFGIIFQCNVNFTSKYTKLIELRRDFLSGSDCLLAYDAVYTYWLLPTFRRNLLHEK